MMRQVLCFGITAGLVVLASAGAGQAQVPRETSLLTMESYVQEVLERNPQLATRWAGREASRHRVPQAGSLPDPVVGLGVMNLPWGSFSFDRADMTMKMLSVSQSFPAPGVRGARTTTAEAGVELAESQVFLTRQSLAQQARLVYLDLYYVERALEFLAENQALLDQFIRISETRYRTGAGIQQDVLKAQLEHSRLTERKITLKARRAGLLSTMNALRDRPAEYPVVLAELPDTGEEVPGAERLMAMAQAHSPPLIQSRAEIARSRAALDLAGLLRRPGWSVSASYAQRDGDRRDLISASVMIQVPLYAARKQKRAVDEQAARMKEAEYRMRDTELSVEAGIRKLLSELDRSRRLTELYADAVLPEAEGVLTSALAGYPVGQVDFLTLISAQSTLFDYQLESIRVITDYHRQIALLEAVVGTSVTSADSGE